MKYLIATLVIACILICTTSVSQAMPTSVKGVTVSPAIEQINLTPNQTLASYDSQVTNNTNTPVELSIGAEDFTSLNLNGGVSFLGKNNNSSSHGLASYLFITSPQFTLNPGQSQVVPIKVLNTNKLATGGHYAALTYKLQNSNNAKGNAVAIQQTVSSLLFVSTYGQGTQATDLTTPVIGSFFTSFPQNLNVVFGNSGNTQTTPRGIVQIMNSSSKVVAQAIINTNSGLILPQSKRLFNLNLMSLGSQHLWPGIYTLRITYNHDGQSTYRIYQQKFLFISLPILLIAIGLILLGFILIARKLLPESLYYRLRRQT
jgi:hypothetical protein